MLNYPLKKKTLPNQKKTNTKLDGKSIYANRGMTLEKDLSDANTYYLNNNKAVIHKKPTPIQVLHIKNLESGSTKIDDAYFLTPSTTDYNGVYKGKYIDFEAKETKNTTRFPLANIHAHQYLHLENIIKHGGIGFFIISFTKINEVYIVDASIIIDYFNKKEASIPYTIIKEKGHLVKYSYPLLLDYLKVVDEIYFNEKIK